MSEDVSLDAISFVPLREVVFVGFAVYQVITTDEDFTCHYNYKIGEKQYPNL